MVGVANKNGKFYAFNRSAINSGPVWKAQIANGGDCPQCGQWQHFARCLGWYHALCGWWQDDDQRLEL